MSKEPGMPIIYFHSFHVGVVGFHFRIATLTNSIMCIFIREVGPTDVTASESIEHIQKFSIVY